MMAAENWSSASGHYEHVLRSIGDDTAVTIKLAQAYENQSDKRAHVTLEAAYSLAGDNPEVLSAYGRSLVAQGNFEQGTSVLKNAVALDNSVYDQIDRATIRFNLARLFE